MKTLVTFLPPFLGGMGLLLFGIHLMSKNLQNIAGHKLRKIFSTLTHNRLAALAVGMFVTMLFQSSTATTVILVGLVNASMVTLKQTLGVILGADIGTTITAQLIALRVTELALPIIGIGGTLVFFTEKDRYQQIGLVLVGFGLLFLGLKVMADTMEPLREAPFFRDLMTSTCDRPLLAIGVSAVFTFLVHSSAASVGIIMVLAMHGMVPLTAAIYLLFGANIGTSFTALICAIPASREAQRVAVAHFLFKVAGVLLFLPFVTPYAAFLSRIAASPGFQVANAHAIFNVGTAFIFLPFLTQFATILERILPDKEVVEEEKVKAKYLDDKLVSTPFIALGLTAKEIGNASDRVFDMACSVIHVFKKNDPELLKKISEEESSLDQTYRAVTNYLTKVMRQSLSVEEFNRSMCYMHIINDLEHIGDIIEKDIVYIANCKTNQQREFSDDGWGEIIGMHRRLCNIMQITNIAMATNDAEAAEKAISQQLEFAHLERRLRVTHFNRLREGLALSFTTSSLHLDLINAFYWISEHAKNICCEIITLEQKVIAAKEERAQEANTNEVPEADSKTSTQSRARERTLGWR
ncbi:MAG TPA: Na/Pi cotransporter family protein [Clostridia bacterium]|nr:Na/Pi cotransporter family protein [Clostridia bacterium]